MLDTQNPNWSEFRREMPVTRKWAYFDHAAVAPLPGVVSGVIAQWAEDAAENGDVPWLEWNAQVERTRAEAAAMLGAECQHVALLRNTTHGINCVAEGYPWQRGDNVVTLADEFPTNQYPWLLLAAQGVETRRVPVEDARVDLNRIAAACDARTRIVSLSWVGFSNGWRIDVGEAAELVHSRGALLHLDAIQALGVFPLDVRAAKIDFLSADGHKWMLGPEGAGVFYLRPEHLDLLKPVGVGWNSVVGAHDFSVIQADWRKDATRYEGGSQNMVGMIALGESLKLLNRFGQAALGERIVQITTYACRRLQEIGAEIHVNRQPGHESGIVLFDLPGRDPQALRKDCLDAGIVLSHRAGRLRISPHAYNTEEEVDRLIEVLGR